MSRGVTWGLTGGKPLRRIADRHSDYGKKNEQHDEPSRDEAQGEKEKPNQQHELHSLYRLMPSSLREKTSVKSNEPAAGPCGSASIRPGGIEAAVLVEEFGYHTGAIGEGEGLLV